jgi:GxxExxY protein
METIKDQLTSAVIGAGIDVHRLLGPGLFETVYDECLAWELEHRGLTVNRQVLVPVAYKEARLEASYRIDLLVEGKLVVEVKAVERILPVHEAQILTCMKMSRSPVGLLLNFNTPVLKDGIKRFVNRRGAEEDREAGSEEPNGAAETPGRRGCAEDSPQR